MRNLIEAIMPRVTVRETADGLGILVYSERRLRYFRWLVLGLTPWCFFGLVLFDVGGLRPPDGIDEVWYVLWALAGLAAVGVGVWREFRRFERLFITGGALVFSRGRRRTIHPLDEVKNVRIRTLFVPGEGKGRHLIPRSVMSFDAGGRTYDFGTAIDAEERSAVYHALLRHLPPGARADAEEDPEDA